MAVKSTETCHGCGSEGVFPLEHLSCILFFEYFRDDDERFSCSHLLSTTHVQATGGLPINLRSVDLCEDSDTDVAVPFEPYTRSKAS